LSDSHGTHGKALSAFVYKESASRDGCGVPVLLDGLKREAIHFFFLA
jgi:hypothetical protein